MTASKRITIAFIYSESSILMSLNIMLSLMLYFQQPERWRESATGCQ